MANAKISQLPAAGAITGAELAVVVQGGTTSQTTIDDILTGTTFTTVDLGTPTAGNLSNCTDLPIVAGTTGTLSVARGGTGITSFGTGVATALGVNVGSAGAVVTNGGALGTPASGTLTNCTLPVGGVTGLGAGVATFLATPSSSNLASAVTGETGSGALVFGTGPTISAPVLTLKSYTFAGKPGSPATGDVAVLTGCDDGLAWGAIVTGVAGTSAYLSWFDGTNWSVMGKAGV